MTEFPKVRTRWRSKRTGKIGAIVERHVAQWYPTSAVLLEFGDGKRRWVGVTKRGVIGYEEVME